MPKMTRETHPREFEAGERLSKYLVDNGIPINRVLNNNGACRDVGKALGMTDMQVVEACLAVIQLLAA